MIWKKTFFKTPDQIGWHSGSWSIYAKSEDGPCVLSSGAPRFFGPEHYPSVTLACQRAEELQAKDQALAGMTATGERTDG